MLKAPVHMNRPVGKRAATWFVLVGIPLFLIALMASFWVADNHSEWNIYVLSGWLGLMLLAYGLKRLGTTGSKRRKNGPRI